MKILLIHGPNLNMLGKRKEVHYGSFTQEELFNNLSLKFLDVDFSFYQSNSESDIISMIHHSGEYDALLINPGAYTHTSIAIRDALEIMDLIKVEVHLSNIEEREDFRKLDYIKDVCDARFMGNKQKSYEDAVNFIIQKFAKNEKISV